MARFTFPIKRCKDKVPKTLDPGGIRTDVPEVDALSHANRARCEEKYVDEKRF
jgi:hypothetical protein